MTVLTTPREVPQAAAKVADTLFYPDETKISAAIGDAILALDVPEVSGEKVTCGTCRLHASNFYGNSKNGWVRDERETDCCADVEFDMPASFNNQTPMDAATERWCPVWRPVEPPPPRKPRRATMDKMEARVRALGNQIALQDSQMATDVARHVGDKVHELVKMHAMTLPSVAAAIGMGVAVARRLLDEVKQFAVASIDGDEAEVMRAAIDSLFHALPEGRANG